MVKKLVMTFNDSTSNKFSITVNSVKSDVTAEEINSIMDLIITSKVFASKKGDLVSKASAETIDTTETSIAIA